ncbi:MAG: response regulator [Candidatus Magnetomorum sp.]|nr:response regulator [Candidatus Magnetomorum sp.]
MTKILIIDDKKDNRISISEMLRAVFDDCVTLTAGSGPEGIEKAKMELPDTILLDLLMPGMDGFDVCRQLKFHPTTCHIPVIFITGVKTDTETRIKGLDIGADAFLYKPLDRAELAAQVKVMLRIKEAEDELRFQRDQLKKNMHDTRKELLEAEKLYKTLFMSAADLMFLINLDGEIIEVNSEACYIMGYSQKELISNTPISINPAFEKKLNAMMDIIRNKKSAFFDMSFPTKTGQQVPLEISCQRIEYDGQHVILAIARDISERKQASLEKQKLESQLRQAQKMEAIGTLAGGIAHDFNNILFPIFGYTQILMKKCPDRQEFQDYLQNILKAARRAKDLSQQILTFSRQSKHEHKPVMLSPIVKECLKLLRASLPSTISVKQDIDSDIGLVLADPTELHQIIMNLCTNAYHAMRDSGGILDVRLKRVKIEALEKSEHPELAPGQYLNLMVRDTGKGIDSEILSQIFEPYFTTKPQGEGTGLGLYIIYGIVKNLSGKIDVQSQINEGTVFNIYIPAFLKPKSQDSQDMPMSQVPGGTERILLVDDEAPIIEMMTFMLEQMGYLVTARTSSREALDLFRTHPDHFDLVITDQTMPELTGDILFQKIKAIRKDMPVILCTGYSEKLSHEQAQQLGIDAYLCKPVVLCEMGAVIRRIIDANK